MQLDVLTGAAGDVCNLVTDWIVAGLSHVAGSAIANLGPSQPNAMHLFPGMRFQITGANEQVFNGHFTVNAVSFGLGVYQVAFSLPNYDVASATATGTIHFKFIPLAQSAIFLADHGNTADVKFGPDNQADYFTLEPGASYQLTAPENYRFNLLNFFFRCPSAIGQTIKILYV